MPVWHNNNIWIYICQPLLGKQVLLNNFHGRKEV